ncbi:MAG: glycine--tRNA ligase subunit beta [Caldilinea sp. CFX5]|nr:glycine--tRNA ligase subunit beta [Caldilinea sp. CFX5]
MQTQALSMQEVILRLHDYWAAHGCLIWQPYSEKVGAGTMNPGTVLRVLGPEPWNIAYVEPSFRADDGRYAENPNRMQMHHQYQVILKPDPGNPQELYLGSLEAIGLDRTRHDIRFVEDNWESPALGAWGLGWEVWLDGQEITQFTYFQQAGSLTLDPVSVEITYGLDRIVMYLQNRSQVWDIDVDGQHTFAQIYKDPEVEHCIYNFELADVERLKQLYDIYRAEADACIRRGLVIPAHDFVLRQSQTFNLLDARGAIGVTERAKFFAAMRNQARSVSELYVKQREAAGFPWLQSTETGDTRQETRDRNGITPHATLVLEGRNTPHASFLLEIGSEELPPQDVVDGLAQIEANLTRLLGEYKLSYTNLRVTGTTRRLVAYVTELAPQQADETVEKRGPALDRAYDGDGKPTKAAEGFARGQGVDVAELEKRDNYVYAIKRVAGQPTPAVLPQLCTDLLNSLRWGKTMRWNSSNVGYPRPLRWLVALLGNQVIPFTWAGVSSGATSRGPRFADAAAQLPVGGFTTFAVESADSYFATVAQQGVIVDRAERRRRIAELVQQTAAAAGGVAPDDPDLLDEVTDLVEAPQALLGSFEEKYLALPAPVLVGVMKKHQRYFPVVRNGQMLAHFITIANAQSLAHPAVVVAGNEGVIRARYADAAYFYRQDTARPLESYTPRLATLTFHERLGSMLDKVERLKKIAPAVAQLLKAGADAVADAERAAALAKSDLVTAMVVEMTSLQGIIGEIYARQSGERDAVAQAIREQYLPRSAGDANPATVVGLALSLADKLDSLAGLFAVGAIPTGSADPFGLRRAALGVVNNLLTSRTDFSIRAGLQVAAAQQNVVVTEAALAETMTFIERRFQGVLAELGYPYDVVDAVLAVRGDNPAAAQRACDALQQVVAQPGWSDTFTAYARCARITRNLTAPLSLNPAAYTDAVEQDLHAAYEQAHQQLGAQREPATVIGDLLQRLQGPINAYFEKVLVNAADEQLRNARLALVQQIAQLPAAIADLSKLQGF